MGECQFGHRSLHQVFRRSQRSGCPRLQGPLAQPRQVGQGERRLHAVAREQQVKQLLRGQLGQWAL